MNSDVRVIRMLPVKHLFSYLTAINISRVNMDYVYHAHWLRNETGDCMSVNIKRVTLSFF